MRRGSSSLLILFAILLVLAAVATLSRSMDTARHAVRLELATELTTALESALEEAWWIVGRAVPAGAEGQGGDGVHSLGSQVLAALEAGNASTATEDRLTLTISAAPGCELDRPRFAVHAVDGSDGLVSFRASGRARRGGLTVTCTIEQRRRFHVERTPIALGEETIVIPTVHIAPEVVDVEVRE